MLGTPGPGRCNAQFQGDRAKRAEITGRALRLCFAWAVLATLSRDLLELLPVQGAELPHDMTGHRF